MKTLLRNTLLASFALLATGCFRSTAGTEVGIKVGKIFGADQVVTPGTTVMVIPIMHDWYVFDTKTQSLEMKGAEEQGGDELDFKTRDGNDIGVDVTVLYHIDPAKAPNVLRTVASDMMEVKRALVRPLARAIPRDALNELSSEDFYDSDKRSAAETKADQNLATVLEPYGIVCERVVLGNYRFHQAYQAAIDAKKVADQAVNKNKSAAEAAAKEWERELETTKGQVNQLIAAETGKAEQVHLQADAYYEAKKLEADATLAEKTANAKGIQKLKEAYSGAGGRTMVKLRIAEALKGKRIVLYPTSDNAMNIQHTDVNKFLETMGLQSISGGGGAGAAPTGNAPEAPQK
ncbi:MAG TPA: SPFH domain-containing protein [bacterium]|nr:SPFH domain-containing protein [bacterium]